MTIIDQYINQFPAEIQPMLFKLKAVILKAAPKATEIIKYGIPTFYLEGNLVHFAAYKNHIGFYPAPSGLKAFQKEINAYKNSKGAVQFPIDKPIPYSLISKIVKFRVKENIEKANNKRQLKTCKLGHQFYKSSSCLTCPICAKQTKPTSNFMSVLSAPARRALESEGIKTIKQLSKYSEKDLLALHGFGPSSIPKLKQVLVSEGLKLKNN